MLREFRGALLLQPLKSGLDRNGYGGPAARNRAFSQSHTQSKAPAAKSRGRRCHFDTWLPDIRLGHRGRAVALAEQTHGVDEGLQHPQHERDADEAPGEHELQGGRGVWLIDVVHVHFSPYARAPARTPTGSTPRSSFSLMWNFLSTALTKKLQMNPITSNPAMMYMVVL